MRLPIWLQFVLAFSLLAFLIYALIIRFLFWDPWDRRARKRAIKLIATAPGATARTVSRMSTLPAGQ